MKISQDTQQRLLAILYLVLDSYRIIIGSFFSIFVPQSCEDIPSLSNSTQTYHACTLEDNTTNLTIYNQYVLGFNALTAAVLVATFVIEFRREHWLIKHLDVDPTKPDDNLAEQMKTHSALSDSLHRLNRDYYLVLLVAAGMNLINAVSSAVLMAHYYDGFKTTATFITNALLIVLRLVKSIQIARTCQIESKAQSVYLLEPTTFNVIEEKYQLMPVIVPVLSGAIASTPKHTDSKEEKTD
jgi:hypothetical protein